MSQPEEDEDEAIERIMGGVGKALEDALQAGLKQAQSQQRVQLVEAFEHIMSAAGMNVGAAMDCSLALLTTVWLHGHAHLKEPEILERIKLDQLKLGASFASNWYINQDAQKGVTDVKGAMEFAQKHFPLPGNIDPAKNYRDMSKDKEKH